MPKKTPNKKLQKLVNFIFEVGTAKNIFRSHRQVLPWANDTVASHSFRTAIIGLFLAELEGADKNKVMRMCLFHDLAELRTGDANYIQKFYRSEDEHKAIREQWKDLMGGHEIKKLLSEYMARKTKEAAIAKDADNLDQLALQIEYLPDGSYSQKRWNGRILRMIKTKLARQLADLMIKSPPFKWLYDFLDSKKK